MKEIKAFLHRNRVADVVHALKTAHFIDGNCNLSICDVAGNLAALDEKEISYSIEWGKGTTIEAKLELICENERTDEAIALIKENGRTGQPLAGWVYVTDISAASRIDG